MKALLVVAVVVLHAGKVPMSYTDGAYSLPSRVWFALAGNNILLMAVPCFFAISGFLHFRSYQPGAESYFRMVRKKTRTLLLPYLLLNIAAILVVACFRKIPYIADINALHARGWLDLAFGVDTFPILYPLWYLRDLYILFLATPVFLLLANRMGALLLLVPVGLLAVYTDQTFYLSLRGVIFFGLGLFFARHEDLLTRRANVPVFAGVYVLLTLAEAARLFLDPHAAPLGPLNLAATFFALPLIWQWAARFDERPESLAVRFGGVAFFVYLLHEPVLSYLIYLSRFVLKPVGPVLEPLGMAVIAGLTVLSLTALGNLLQRGVPGFFGLLTGGRVPVAGVAAVKGPILAPPAEQTS